MSNNNEEDYTEQNRDQNETQYEYNNNNNYQPNENNTNQNQTNTAQNNAGSDEYNKLVSAIDSGDITRVTEILGTLTNVSQVASKGDLIMMALISIDKAQSTYEINARISILDRLFKKGFNFYNIPGHDYGTTLAKLTPKIGIDVLPLLLSVGLPIQGVKSTLLPLLYSAVQEKNFELADKLIEAGANYNQVIPETKNSILYDTILKDKNIEGAKYLIEKKANVNWIDRYGDTILHSIIKDRDLQGVPELQLLFASYIAENPYFKAEVKDQLGRNALQTAVLLANPKITELLIKNAQKNKYDITLQLNDENLFPLELALLRSSFYKQGETNFPKRNESKVPQFDQIVRILLENKAKISAGFLMDRNIQLFKYALDTQDTLLIRSLMDYYRYYLDRPFIDGETPITYIYKKGDFELLNFLINTLGLSIDSQNATGSSILHIAVTQENPYDAIYRIEQLGKKPKFDLVDLEGNTPISIAVQRGDFDIFDLLKLRGASLKGKNKQGQTLIMLAIQSGNQQIIDSLLELKPELNLGDLTGKTPLIYAVEKGDKDLVEKLLEKGAGPEYVDKQRNTLIMIAMKKNYLSLIPFLLEETKKYFNKKPETAKQNFSSYINYSDLQGVTPVLQAVLLKNFDLVKQLVENGADISKKDKEGRSPVLLALQEENNELLDFFESKGVTKLTDLFVGAAKLGLTNVLINLLTKEGLDVNDTADFGGVKYTAYDVAKNMETRLLLAPYYQTDKPRFEGFGADEFYKFESMFLPTENESGNATINLKITAICPFCFAQNNRIDGCMYISHDCFQVQSLMEKAGSSIFVHEKLYRLYKTGGMAKWCIYCNRPTTDTERNGTEGHRHYDILSASLDPPLNENLGKPVHLPLYSGNMAVQGDTGAGYFDKTCFKNGGGDIEEKIFRLQKLLDFMCFLNKEFVGKISATYAQMLIREFFIECPIVAKDYFTQRERYVKSNKKFEDKPITVTPLITSIHELKERIIANNKFEIPEDCIKKEEEEAKEEAETAAVVSENAPNAPRDPRNANLFPKILPQPVIENEPPFPKKNSPQEVKNAYAAFEADVESRVQKCEYHNERHLDGRDLYQFFHRQPTSRGGNVFDHEDSYICKEGLVEFIQFKVMDATTSITCFDTFKCRGFIHPLEIKDIFTEPEEVEIWEGYKKRWNKNPPELRGGAQEEPKKYVLFFEDPTPGDLLTCPLPKRKPTGGKRHRITRKGRYLKKTRKVRRTTRKH